jgi:hypothetical protein
LKVVRSFGGTCDLRFQDLRVSQARNQHEADNKQNWLVKQAVTTLPLPKMDLEFVLENLKMLAAVACSVCTPATRCKVYFLCPKLFILQFTTFPCHQISVYFRNIFVYDRERKKKKDKERR